MNNDNPDNYIVETNGYQYFVIGKTRIKITEHFPDKGRALEDIITNMICSLCTTSE